VVDPGAYRLTLAPSSATRDVQQELVVKVTGTLAAVPVTVSAKPQALGDAEVGIEKRLLFPRDTVIDPQLTLALSDDTLYGYITQGKSTPLLPDMVVEYESNRPKVVSVDGAGVIRTGTSNGVATVSVAAEYAGVRVTTAFVVYVR
jgi:beta-glucosidase